MPNKRSQAVKTEDVVQKSNADVSKPTATDKADNFQLADSITSSLHSIIRRSSDMRLKKDCCNLFKVTEISSIRPDIRENVELLLRSKFARKQSAESLASEPVSKIVKPNENISTKSNTKFEVRSQSFQSLSAVEDPDFFFNSLDSFHSLHR